MLKVSSARHFRFNEGCHIVSGACGAAIYDLIRGDVYSIDKRAAVVFQEGLHRKIGDQFLLAKRHGILKEDFLDYLNQFIRMGLADVSAIHKHVDTLKSFYEGEVYSKRADSLRLLTLTCEIGDACNLGCFYCGNSKIKITNCTCETALDKQESLKMQDWKRVLEEAALFNCTSVAFMGGEPLLMEEQLIKLIAYSEKVGFKRAIVYTNGTLISHNFLAFLRSMKALDVKILTPIFSCFPKVHDLITGVKGSLTRTINNLTNMKKQGTDVRAYMLVFRQNEHTAKETARFFRGKGIGLTLEGARLNKYGLLSGLGSEEYSHLVIKKEAKFDKVRLDNFYMNKKWNPCWGFCVSVRRNGDIVPCIKASDLVVGNVKQVSLRQTVLEGRLDSYWNLSLDRVRTCKDCEFRYACRDCRISALSLCGDMLVKNPYCAYDPYSGNWNSWYRHLEILTGTKGRDAKLES